MQEVDQAGNMVRRLGVNGYPRAKFGGGTARSCLYSKRLSLPQQLLTQIVEHSVWAGLFYVEPLRRNKVVALTVKTCAKSAILLGCEAEHMVGYGLCPRGAPSGVPIVGQNCRLCERPHCAQRAEPPVARPLMFDGAENSVSAFKL